MIVELHDSLESIFQDDKMTDDVMCQLCALLRLRRKGQVFIIAKRQTLLMLKTIDLGAHDRRIVNILMDDQTQWKNLLQGIGFRIVLTSHSSLENITLTNQTSFSYMNLNEFICDQVTLITENINDADYLIEMTRSYLEYQLNIRGIQLNANKKPGGGSTTSQVIREHQKNHGGLAYCVLDSDKQHPHADYGDTAKKVIDDVCLDAKTHIKYTDSREIENLIPFDLLKQVLSSDCNLLKVKNFCDLANLSIHGENPVKYIDLKKGLKKFNVSNLVTEEHSSFWQMVFDAIGNIELDCSCTRIKSCTCVVIDGFGTNLLTQVVTYLKENSYDITKMEHHAIDEIIGQCRSILPFLLSPLRIAS
jgi:hypothetical protein